MDVLKQLFSTLLSYGLGTGFKFTPVCFSSIISIPFSNISSNIIKHQLKYANKFHLNNIENNLKSLISKQSKISEDSF